MNDLKRVCALLTVGVLLLAVPAGLVAGPKSDDDAIQKRVLNRSLNQQRKAAQTEEAAGTLNLEKRGMQKTKGSADGANDSLGVGDDEGNEFVPVCHKPGKRNEKTLYLPEEAVGGHLQHGDFEGQCPGDQTPTSN